VAPVAGVSSESSSSFSGRPRSESPLEFASSGM
jgi:hypothetical protein